MGLDIPDTSADPGAIRGAAARLESVATRMLGHGQDSGAAIDRAAPSFSDLVSPTIRARGRRAVAAVQRTVQQTVYGAGVTDQWADDVEWFKAERRRLLDAYDDQAARRFGVAKPDRETAPSDHTGQLRRAQSAAERRYAASGAELYARFKERARVRGRDLTSPPTAKRLRELDAAGNLPLSAYAIYERHRVQWARPHALIARLIAAGVLPRDLASMSFAEGMRYLEQHPDVARRLTGQHALFTSPDPAERILAVALAGAGMAAVRTAFGKISAEQRGWLAMMLPGVIGNLRGAPFEARAYANRVRIVAERPRAHAELESLRERLGQQQESLRYTPSAEAQRAILAEVARIEDRMKELRGQVRTYDSVLRDNRWFVHFDPRGDGQWAELVNPVGKDTRNVAIFVPGTNSSLGGANTVHHTARAFADQSGGKLSVLVFGGGDFPDGIPQAVQPRFAQQMAPALVDFSHQVRQEIHHSPAAGNGVKVTAAGHSYGGAIVGLAERHGLDADRILHISSAGAGHGIDSTTDYRNANGDVPRYAMTAPGDWIAPWQGKGVLGLGHGEDIDELPGVTRLTTGNYADGTPIRGTTSHGGVLREGGHSWWQIYHVLTGGEVEVEGPPRCELVDGEVVTDYVPRLNVRVR